MISAALAISITTGLAASPRAAAASPKNRENTTICRISLVAIASITLFGMAWVTKSLREMAVAATPELAPSSGRERERPTPGCIRCTITSPRVRDIREASINQPRVLAPMRPTVRVSPILAMPTTRVVNTRGAMIILMRRRKMSVSRVMSLAKVAAWVGANRR